MGRGIKEGTAQRSAIVVAAVSFGLYSATACPTVPFGDGGELIAASNGLGVAHPPGYPVYTLLGWLALRIPLGEPALRMNLLSALFGALAAAGLAWLVSRATASWVAGVGAGLALAVSATFWLVATTAEVYTLHLLLITVLLCAAQEATDAQEGGTRRRAFLAGAAALGLGLSHHPTIVLAAPAAAFLLRRRGSRSRPPLGGAHWSALALVAGLPLVFLGSLGLRARLFPDASWGDLAGGQDLWAHITASGYRRYFVGWDGWLRGETWTATARLLVSDLSIAAPFLAVFGWAVSQRRSAPVAERRLAWSMLVLLVANALFGMAYSTEDVAVFFLPCMVAIAAASGLAVAWIERATPKHGRGPAALVALALVLIPALGHFPSRNLHAATAARDYGRDLLASVPRDGVLFVEGDDAFILAYLTAVLGERKDVTIYDREGNLFRNLLREAGSPPRRGESFEEFRARREIEFLAAERAKPHARSVLFMSWPGYELPRGYRYEPTGLLYRVRPAADGVQNDSDLWSAYHEEGIREEASRTGGFFERTVAGIYPFMRGERALLSGDRPAAERHFEDARQISLGAETLRNAIGLSYARLGDFRSAVREFEAAVSRKPTSLRARANLERARASARASGG